MQDKMFLPLLCLLSLLLAGSLVIHSGDWGTSIITSLFLDDVYTLDFKALSNSDRIKMKASPPFSLLSSDILSGGFQTDL